VQGDPGSGKTTLALQFVFGRKQAGERCLYISLTESRKDLENTCRSHSSSLDDLEICDLSRSAANVSGEPESSVISPEKVAKIP
jgi:circadian clock protein KaiC